ncbi:isoleucine--tRNA ligase [Risungbinella massiliensis]|uniref:isoleucine--tRNA ligase n=1 Tax=Risungbinella massiliensis TaxID=1329796 RepID=UPI0005CBD0B8|nr:isoleucine--tRNA ligase [Risungbinella massiliensis]
MADYSKTLHLPKTDFPMRGNLPNREPEMQNWWKEINLYQQLRENRSGKPKFILHDGPPYANGDIHIGHALNKTLKDFITRYKSAKGYDAPYVPGWDTHGLPIEHAIVTKKKIDRNSVSPVEFRELCSEYAWSFVNKQSEQFQRIGILGDWENPYVTLRPEYEARQVRVFGEMVAKGHIYRGMKTIYWSPTSETALAEAEIEYQDKRSASIYVAFPVKDGKGVLPVENTHVVIWTTTPWTIPANLGIALNAEFEYSLVRAGDKQYLLAKELVAQVMQKAEIEEYEEVAVFRGQDLEGVICQHPLYDRESPLLLGEHVTLDAGTGCVHTAPGHGEDDFWLGQKYGLDVLCPVDEKGVLTKQAPGFEGLFYDKANKPITEKLAEKGLLLKMEFITHQYPHDWRTKKPVIFRATEQWFASIDGFRQDMLKAIEGVKWTPTWGEVRLSNMIRDRGDWCISRQRIWGVPLPIFYCRDCGEPHINEETVDFIANLFAAEGSNAWYAKETKELMPVNQSCGQCGGTDFRKETDTMDVWFDSGSSQAAVLQQRPELQWPADIYLEGSDQYRGWFNSSLSTSVATTGQAPYKQVLSHGFTLDGEGRKMSKSLGNVVVPEKVMKQYGADILRLWVSSVDYQADMRLSDNILKQIAEAYRKMRNTFRFLLGNLEGFDPETHRVETNQLTDLDRFAAIQLQRLVQKVTKAYDHYEFNQVYHLLHTYCTVFLSQFYLDVLKDRLYVEASHSHVRRSAQTVLYDTLVALVKMVGPIMPHTAEEVWKHTPGVAEMSVHMALFPEVEESVLDDKLEQTWNELLEVRDVVLKSLEEARASKLIGNSLGAKLMLTPNEKTAALLQQVDSLEQFFIVSQVEVQAASSDVSAEQKLLVEVSPAEGEKCERCWNILPTVGESDKHPTLCNRCVEVVEKDYPEFEVVEQD